MTHFALRLTHEKFWCRDRVKIYRKTNVILRKGNYFINMCIRKCLFTWSAGSLINLFLSSRCSEKIFRFKHIWMVNVAKDCPKLFEKILFSKTIRSKFLRVHVPCFIQPLSSLLFLFIFY